MADYLYGSANVRALESAIIGRERIARLLETKTLEDAYAYLAECGVELVYRDGAVAREETLLGILRAAYGRIAELAPDSEALRLWRYPYDCNNIKAAIKAQARGISPDTMMFDFGTLGCDELADMIRTNSVKGLPEAMQKATAEAQEAFVKTRNPQTVDLILDRACYRDMLKSAKRSKNAYTKQLVTAKIDFSNLMILLRILRMNSGEAGKRLFADSCLEGGALSRELLRDALDLGEDALLRTLRTTEYAEFADAFLISDRSLRSAERLSDDLFMKMVQRTRFIPIGLEVMVAFLLGHEYEVRNLRIVLSGKEAGLDTQTIRERIRESYV